MNRRDLIKKFALGAPALVMAIPGPPLSSLTPPEDFTFHGWRINWRDWQSVVQQDALCGQWIAYSTEKHGWHLYSSWPGACGPFMTHYVFDLSMHDDQMMLNRQSTQEELDYCKSECLERLKRLIVKVGPPPLDIDKYREMV
jgi:hypothetical protein